MMHCDPTPPHPPQPIHSNKFTILGLCNMIWVLIWININGALYMGSISLRDFLRRIEVVFKVTNTEEYSNNPAWFLHLGCMRFLFLSFGLCTDVSIWFFSESCFHCSKDTLTLLFRLSVLFQWYFFCHFFMPHTVALFLCSECLD